MHRLVMQKMHGRFKEDETSRDPDAHGRRFLPVVPRELTTIALLLYQNKMVRVFSLGRVH